MQNFCQEKDAFFLLEFCVPDGNKRRINRIKGSLNGIEPIFCLYNNVQKRLWSTQQEQDFDGTNFALYNIYNETIIINRIKEQKDEN